MENQETNEITEVEKKEIPYKHVGGLKKEIERIRFLVELPYQTSKKTD